tara:strand:+ start:184 stop:1602 length:1419 start_codon:yes stop_codon:yes gene_type:complete
MNNQIHCEVVVIGAGPGGYAAAFRAADLGKKVVLINKESQLGGVCLNRGCIPSKALLHLAKVIEDAQSLKQAGIDFKTPNINIEKIREWKELIIKNLATGIMQLSKSRKVQVINGTANFLSPNKIQIESNEKIQTISFDNCIIATGSLASKISHLSDDNDKVFYSANALEINNIPKKMLIIGGGYIGLEMGTVYNALGTDISIVEFMPSLLPNIDNDLVKPLLQKIKNTFKEIILSTKVTQIDNNHNDITVHFESEKGEPSKQNFDTALIAVGRKPNTKNIGLNNINISMDKNGFILVNKKQQTNLPHIYAIGDVTGEPMLAHKASHEGKVAAEVICGLPSLFQPSIIPAVIFTDPEIAWAGPTESMLKMQNIKYIKKEFPWSASGKAISMNRIDGKTKLIFDSQSKKIISAGIVGPNAGDLISEAVIAIEMGADAEDISLSIHPHPTLSETIANTAEILTGTITDLYVKKE